MNQRKELPYSNIVKKFIMYFFSNNMILFFYIETSNPFEIYSSEQCVVEIQLFPPVLFIQLYQ